MQDAKVMHWPHYNEQAPQGSSFKSYYLICL